jgi:hypothetical protein
MVGDLALLPQKLALELVWELEMCKAKEMRNESVRALLMMVRTGLSLDAANLQYHERQGIEEVKKVILEAEDIMNSGYMQRPTDDEMLSIEAEVMKVINNAKPADTKPEVTSTIAPDLPDPADDDSDCDDDPILKDVIKINKATLEEHHRQGHLDFRRDCVHCLRGGGRNRQHRRQEKIETGAVSLDPAGPVKQSTEGYKYFMVATYTMSKDDAERLKAQEVNMDIIIDDEQGAAPDKRVAAFRILLLKC